MQTMVSDSTDALLHRTLCLDSPYAIVVADHGGRVLEWNRMAEQLTGIPRDDAVSRVVWEVCSRVAPARIPYEVALRTGKDAFLEMLELVAPRNGTAEVPDASSPRVQRREGNVLSTTGRVFNLTVDLFPLWIDNAPAIVGLAIRAEPA